MTGVVGLAAGLVAGGRYTRWYALVFGVIYSLVTIIGFIQGTTVLGIISVNLADNFLHLGIAVASPDVYFVSANVPARAAVRARA